MKIKSKKLLALVTVFAMILSFMPTHIFASTGTYVKVSDVEANVGEDVTIEIKAAQRLRIDELQLKVFYDTEYLYFDDSTEIVYDEEEDEDVEVYKNLSMMTISNSMSDFAPYAAGEIRATCVKASTYTVTADKTILTVKFNTLKAGTTNVRVEIKVKDADTDFSDEETVNGQVTINSNSGTVVDTGIHLNKTELRLTEGGSEKLVATVEPEEATDKAVTWSSEDDTIATVDNEGNVVAVKEGTTTITAKSASGKEATCSVIVSKVECTHTSLRTVSAVEPTCTVEGNNEYKVCNNCGKVFKADGVTPTTVADETISALGHDFSVDNHDENQHWKECSRCHIPDTKIDHTGQGEYQHDNEYHWKVCGCGVVVEKEAHTPGNPTEENKVDATCTESGSYDEVICCSVCGYEISRTNKTIDPKGHTAGPIVNENIVEASCTTDGSHDEVVYCTVCRAEISRTHKVDTATGHTPGDPVNENVVPATCSQEGSYDEVVYCTRCHGEIARTHKTIDKLPHDVANVAWSHDETQHWKECGCGTKVDLADHEPAEAVNENVVSASCTADGSHDEVVYCSVCGYEISRENKVDLKLGHNPGETVTENVVEPTCTADGSHDEVVYCTRCNAEISRESKVDLKLGHNPGETVTENVVEPTCTVDGSHDEVVYCTRCNAEISRESKVDLKLGHNPGETVTENVVEPTCTVDGSHDEVVYCTRCNAEISRESKVDLKLGHDLADPVKENIVEPTCTTDGSHDEVVYCTRCHEEMSRTAKTDSALGHDPADPVKENEVEATVDSEGSYDEVVYCSRCHEELSRTKKTTPKFVYEITEGNLEHKEKDKDSIIIRTNGKKGKLLKVIVDGEELTEDDYSLEDGDTATIVLKPGFLNKLPKGTHKISLAFDDGEISTNFNIVQNNNPSSPKTGDSSNLPLWIIGLVVSGILFVIIFRWVAEDQRKRSRH